MVVYWFTFSIFVLLHLGTCFFKKEKLRKISKVFIIPFLMVGLLITKTYNLFLYAGLILGWIGDIFLLFANRKQFFIIGAISFALGHIAYIIATLRIFIEKFSLTDIPIWAYITLSICAVAFLLLTFLKTKKHLGKLAFLMAFYFYILVIAILTGIVTDMYLLSIGFAVFVISDSILSINKYFRPIKRDHFFIMSTYILAQTLIVISFMLSQ